MPRKIEEVLEERRDSTDYRWMGPLHECPCGTDLFVIVARFHERQVAMYYTTGLCTECGARVTIPTEADDEE